MFLELVLAFTAIAAYFYWSWLKKTQYWERQGVKVAKDNVFPVGNNAFTHPDVVKQTKNVNDITREQYEALGYPAYNWVENPDQPPFTPLAKPLSQARVGLVASGGIYRLGQVAFHYKDDISYRRIQRDTDNQDLRITHFAYDLTDARADPNVVFPLDTLRHLERASRIGSLATNALTFMGGIYSARRVRDVRAPAIVAELVNDEVDVAILVPV